MSKKFNGIGPSQKKMNFSELFDRYYYVLIIAAALIAAVIIGVMVYNHFQEEAYQKQLILGEKYLEEGKYEESILAFDSAIRIKDKNPAAYRRKAAVYAGTGNTKALTRLVKTYPTYFINYSQTKTSKSNNSQNYTLPGITVAPSPTTKKADFEDSVVALSTDSKGQNKYSVDMDLVGANTDGGKIYYTTDGTKPTEKSKAYQKPIDVEVKDNDHPVTVKAIAKNDKKEQTKVYDTTLEYSDIKAPSIVTKADEKNEGKFSVTIKCDEKNAQVFYTTDGKDPSSKSEQYKKSFTIDVKEGETKTIKAVSVLKDKTSGVVSEKINFVAKKDNETNTKNDNNGEDKKTDEKKAFVEMPTIVISQDGKDAAVYHVNILTATEGNKIYYTKDGKDPTVKSAAYKDAFTVKAQTGKTITIKAIAVDKNGNVSDIAKQEETPVVVNIPKATDQKESDTKEKQTNDTKTDGSKSSDTKNTDTKSSDTKNTDSKSTDSKSTESKSSDSTTAKDKTASSDSNKDTSLKDDSLPTVPKETQGKESDASDSASSSAKSDSSSTDGTTSNDSSSASGTKSGNSAASATTDAGSSTSSKSDSGSSAKTSEPSVSAPAVSAAPAVNLTAPVLEKSKSQTGSGVKIEWKPVTGADGYEYHYENGTFVDEKAITTTTYEALKNKEEKSTSFTLKVRAYHTEGGQKTYSDWSTVYQGSFAQ